MKTKCLFFSLTSFFLLLSVAVLKPKMAYAECSYAGQCFNNVRCVCVSTVCTGPNAEFGPGGEACGSEVIGGVTPPTGVAEINAGAGDATIGIVAFLSVIIRLIAIVAGIWAMINFIIAGYDYITGFGNTGAHQKVRDRLTWSVVGLLVIVSSYALAALIGMFFFDNPSFIIRPELEGALDAGP